MICQLTKNEHLYDFRDVLVTEEPFVSKVEDLDESITFKVCSQIELDELEKPAFAYLTDSEGTVHALTSDSLYPASLEQDNIYRPRSLGMNFVSGAPCPAQPWNTLQLQYLFKCPYYDNDQWQDYFGKTFKDQTDPCLYHVEWQSDTVCP